MIQSYWVTFYYILRSLWRNEIKWNCCIIERHKKTFPRIFNGFRINLCTNQLLPKQRACKPECICCTLYLSRAHKISINKNPLQLSYWNISIIVDIKKYLYFCDIYRICRLRASQSNRQFIYAKSWFDLFG